MVESRVFDVVITVEGGGWKRIYLLRRRGRGKAGAEGKKSRRRTHEWCEQRG